MFTSLRARLQALLVVATLLSWGLAAVWTWQGAHRQVDDLLDAQLAQSARLLMAQTARVAGAEEGRHGREHSRDEDDGDDDDDDSSPHALAQDAPLERRLHFQVWDGQGHLLQRSSNAVPATRLSSQQDGFSEPMVQAAPWRVFSLWDARRNVLVQVGQEHPIRDALVWSLVVRSLAPVLAGLVLALLVMGWAIQRALSPLQRLARDVASRSPDALGPISTEAVPLEVKPLQVALEALLARVQRMMDAEHQFTANAAHELRTPLAAIKTHAQVAQSSTDAQARNHALEQVAKAVDRATHLMEQLLTLARLEPNVPLESPVRLDLHGVAQRVLADMAPVAMAGGKEVELLGGPGAMVQGDATLLGTLVRNVVENAIRHSPSGGVVSVSVGPAGQGGLLLCVEDQGPGIPEEERERVFERFHRGPGVVGPGSGVGLSMVRRIAALHGATVHLGHRQGGAGLRVEVRFPSSLVNPAAT